MDMLLDILLKEEISQRMWEDLRFIHYGMGGERVMGFEEGIFRKKINRLDEGLISSVSLDTAKKLINIKFPQYIYKGILTIDDDDDYEYIEFTFGIIENYKNIIHVENHIKKLFIKKNEIEEIIKFINFLGWYPIRVVKWGIEGKEYNSLKHKSKLINLKDDPLLINNIVKLEPKHIYKIQFEKKFGDKVDILPKYLYHASDSINRASIKSKGLVPKSKTKLYTHTSRVYCITPEHSINDDIDGYTEFKDFFEQLLQFYKTDSLDVYVIDTSKLPTNMKFYKDPFFINAIYTEKNIPYSAIVDVHYDYLKK